MSKRLVLTDARMGVNVYFDTDGSFWVRFLGATKWGRRLYQPKVLDLSITNEGANVTRLVVSE